MVRDIDQVVTSFDFNRMLWIIVCISRSVSKLINLDLYFDHGLIAKNDARLLHETRKILSKTLS